MRTPKQKKNYFRQPHGFGGAGVKRYVVVPPFGSRSLMAIMTRLSIAYSKKRKRRQPEPLHFLQRFKLAARVWYADQPKLLVSDFQLLNQSLVVANHFGQKQKRGFKSTFHGLRFSQITRCAVERIGKANCKGFLRLSASHWLHRRRCGLLQGFGIQLAQMQFSEVVGTRRY